jgi:hypothetical protein
LASKPNYPRRDLRPDPLQASTPAEPARALRQYRARAGDQSLRVIARHSALTW